MSNIGVLQFIGDRSLALWTKMCRRFHLLREISAWKPIAKDLPMDKLEDMIQPASLSDLPELGAQILKGGVKGRVVVDVNK
ncbi:hypothetical protein GCM10009077_37920 [Roseibium denhamense]